MKINLVCIGKIKDKNLLALSQKYIKQVNYFFNLKIIQLKDSNQEKESKAILEYKDKHKGDFFYLLDEKGKEFDSIKFSKEISKFVDNSQNIHFFIAGATGFDKETKLKFKNKLALSQMTFPHEIARVLLLEQIYRASMIVNNRNYHKA